MALKDKYTLPNKELEALIGLRYDVIPQPSWDDLYENFHCDGSEPYHCVEGSGQIFIFQQQSDGNRFRVEIKEQTDELGTVYVVFVTPWESQEAYDHQQAELKQAKRARVTAAKLRLEEQKAEALRLAGTATELMEMQRARRSEGHMTWYTSYRLFAADAREEAIDKLELVNSKARWCLVHDDLVSNPTLEITWQKGDGIEGIQDTFLHELTFMDAEKTQNLQAKVTECLGGDSELVVNSYYSGMTRSGTYRFRAVVFGARHAGKVLMEMTVEDEKLPGGF